jgi:hypothetical protein
MSSASTAKIFIGYDSRMPVASDVLVHSLRKHSSVPLDIRFLRKDELGFDRPDPLASTEFTYTRFLVPFLCGFKGTALFMDCDMLCSSDVSELFELDMSKFALRVVKHDHNPVESVKMDGRIQTRYPRKNWSSLMLMDCSRLTCWTREAVLTRPAAWLHRFEPIPDPLIGEIDPTWNVLDYPRDDTKLLHMTSGGPWFKGYEDCPGAQAWYKAYYEMEMGGNGSTQVKPAQGPHNLRGRNEQERRLGKSVEGHRRFRALP